MRDTSEMMSARVWGTGALSESSRGSMDRMRGLNPAAAPAFPLSRWHESYNRAEVDAFVQRLRNLPAGELSANQVREHRFPPARWAHVGYDVTAVGAYLESVAGQVVAGPGGRRAARPADWLTNLSAAKAGA